MCACLLHHCHATRRGLCRSLTMPHVPVNSDSPQRRNSAHCKTLSLYWSHTLFTFTLKTPSDNRWSYATGFCHLDSISKIHPPILLSIRWQNSLAICDINVISKVGKRSSLTVHGSHVTRQVVTGKDFNAWTDHHCSWLHPCMYKT